MAHTHDQRLRAPALPLVRADGSGYTLGSESVDGFADREELPPAVRARLARLAARYAPGQLSIAQRRLLRGREAQQDRTRVPSPRQAAFQLDREEAALAWEEGVYAELSEDERRWVAEPGTHPELPDDTRYPLTMRELRVLTGSSDRQLRHWADEGLVPAERTGAHRRFYSAAAARSLMLAQMSRQQVAALIALRQGGKHSQQLMVLISSVVASAVNEAEIEPEERDGFLAGARLLVDHRHALTALGV